MERDPDIQREWLRLFDRFVLRLIEMQPTSVLDVGCGRGVLVSQLNDAGILSTGVDPGAPGNDPQILKGDAIDLPFKDNEFEWVTLRHVPHHLPALKPALSECVRVARKGLLIAEPWFDATDHQQRIAELWDRWWKRQHERAGQIHKPCISLSEIKHALPEGEYDIEAEHYRHDAQIKVQAIEKLSQPFVEKLPEDDADRSVFESLIRQIHDRGFSYNGTMIATIRLGAAT